MYCVINSSPELNLCSGCEPSSRKAKSAAELPRSKCPPDARHNVALKPEKPVALNSTSESQIVQRIRSSAMTKERKAELKKSPRAKIRSQEPESQNAPFHGSVSYENPPV